MTDKPFRVLSLDGGGIRGLYTASLLQQLTLRFAKYHGINTDKSLDLGGQFDLIVGTSTGSILAAALAAGVPLENVLNLYRTKAADIFQLPMPLQRGCFGDKSRAALWALRNLFSSANKSESLRDALQSVLNEETVGQLYQRRGIALCIPSIDAETRRAWVFKTPHLKRLTRDDNYKLVDVCMASAAAPIYFPMHVIPSPNHGVNVGHAFVDGGLWANNPVMVALVEALEVAEPNQEIEILSVGTGGASPSQVLHENQTKRGSWQWKGGADIVATSLEAQAYATPYLAKQIAKAIGNRITLHRLQDPQPSSDEAGHLSLDAADSKSLAVLETLGQRATDLNFSALTNPVAPSAELEMAKRIFSNIQQIQGGSNGV